MTLQPLFDQVAVRAIKETETKGGIVLVANLSTSYEGATQLGEVMAVGPGRRERGELVPMSVKEGDRVVFPKNAGYLIRVKDSELRMMAEDAIFATVKE